MRIIEPKRKIKVESSYDVVVVGGGVAGVSAALASARHGKKVLLIEQSFMLGGLATAGLIAIYLPICDGHGKQVSFGIAEELLHLSVKNGYEGEYNSAWLGNDIEKRDKKRFQVQFNPNVYAIELEQLLVKNGVDILYGSSVCSVMLKKGKITHLLIENKSGRTAIAVTNVVDASGDAVVCKLAGENTVEYTQGNVPASWYYAVKDGKHELKMLGFIDIADEDKVNQLVEMESNTRFKGLDGKEISDLTVLSHRTILEHFLKGGKGSNNYALANIATIPQLRMTRRIDGVYTQDDSEMHKSYDDSVGMFSDWRKRGPVYEMPFRTLYGNKIKNLITAGRCISSTEAMWDITRVIPVCAVSGQAAGTACVIADEFSKTDIKKLQELLKKDGVVLHESDL